ncbi:hypothetical protein POTOM_029362 [Populus tomentosa]|uniref:Uncharacterized protein n=1 Tax=Populus tomentosa TaxID=118781 RepID=A0A8X7ZA43_POPTO|nr:hypothetical protein POTOM_029362 [Populus tomentosa]
MRKFDPWPVFFKREWNRNWPFLVGFAITGALITKFSLSLTEEDAKNSPFVQRHKNERLLANFEGLLCIVYNIPNGVNIASFSTDAKRTLSKISSLLVIFLRLLHLLLGEFGNVLSRCQINAYYEGHLALFEFIFLLLMFCRVFVSVSVVK